MNFLILVISATANKQQYCSFIAGQTYFLFGVCLHGCIKYYKF